MTSKLNAFILSGKFSGTLRNPQNDESSVALDYYNEFSTGLTFNPNRLEKKSNLD